jgi:hypothetical protein
MDASIEVLRGLGAVCEDVRMEPMQAYYDTKVTIAESELFSVHRKALMAQPGDFGGDFLARVLPACLFSGPDYVEAQRRRRLHVARMEPIYAKHDVLLTAGPYGPAPRLDAHNTSSFWKGSNIATPFDVTGGPALAQCNGFSQSGLPLSLQFVGRPFDETTVLRAADAYEKATPFRDRRPDLRPVCAADPGSHVGRSFANVRCRHGETRRTFVKRDAIGVLVSRRTGRVRDGRPATRAHHLVGRTRQHLQFSGLAAFAKRGASLLNQIAAAHQIFFRRDEAGAKIG